MAAARTYMLSVATDDNRERDVCDYLREHPFIAHYSDGDKEALIGRPHTDFADVLLVDSRTDPRVLARAVRTWVHQAERALGSPVRHNFSQVIGQGTIGGGAGRATAGTESPGC